MCWRAGCSRTVEAQPADRFHESSDGFSSRHCEPIGRANARPMCEAIHRCQGTKSWIASSQELLNRNPVQTGRPQGAPLRHIDIPVGATLVVALLRRPCIQAFHPGGSAEGRCETRNDGKKCRRSISKRSLDERSDIRASSPVDPAFRCAHACYEKGRLRADWGQAASTIAFLAAWARKPDRERP
jgi:hypothetical protein